jgi:hypothetical protein
MAPDGYVPTSLARRMIARMATVHRRRRIAIFSGPPGIGKTTAIDVFRASEPQHVLALKVARSNTKEVQLLQHILEELTSSGPRNSPLTTVLWRLRRDVFRAICGRVGLDCKDIKSDADVAKNVPPLTIVFDEAQNLSRRAIELMRYWNDNDRCYAPFPIGLVFIGNNEFSLQVDNSGQSAISAAVADRALYVEAFDYPDLTDEDLRMVIERQGVTEPAAIAAIVRMFRGPRSVRSLRRVLGFIEELEDIAEGRPVTSHTVRQALEFS